MFLYFFQINGGTIIYLFLQITEELVSVQSTEVDSMQCQVTSMIDNLEGQVVAMTTGSQQSCDSWKEWSERTCGKMVDFKVCIFKSAFDELCCNCLYFNTVS